MFLLVVHHYFIIVIIISSSPSSSSSSFIIIIIITIIIIIFYHNRNKNYHHHLSQDHQVWQLLGEAYSERGSYQAALKAFLRALELSPSSLFCRFNVAALEHILGDEDLAIAKLEQLVAEAPKYLPALLELGKAYFAKAQDQNKEGLAGSAADSIALALKSVQAALVITQDFQCLWKLLGDICSFTYMLPAVHTARIVYDKQVGTQAVDSLLGLGALAFYRCTKLSSGAEAWSDVAVNLAYQYQSVEMRNSPENVKKAILAAATTAVKKALAIEAQNPNIWNTLGVVSALSKVCCEMCA